MWITSLVILAVNPCVNGLSVLFACMSCMTGIVWSTSHLSEVFQVIEDRLIQDENMVE